MPVADRIYRGGTIHTMDPMTPTTDAVAIDAGTIIAIGDANCTTATGPDTEVIDLNGRTLIPGFHDAHAHPVLGGLGMVECNLDDIHGYQPYLDRIAEYADEHPDDEWVLGSGWYGDVFTDGFPHRRDLDSVVSDRPASITSHDAHGTWVNTRALEVAGITRDTPDPDGGRIVKDAEGNPTGLLFESAAELVTGLFPPNTPADVELALRNSQDYFHSLGIVGWQDAGVGVLTGSPIDTFHPYISTAEDGGFASKVTAALWWDRAVPYAQQIETVKERRATFQGIDGNRRRGGLQATVVKIMLDGVCENLTGALKRSYRGHDHEHGLLMFEADELNEIVSGLEANDFDVHIHAVGDNALKLAVDALTQNGGPSPARRHQVAHLDIADPAELARMAKAGIIANVQPLWARRDSVLVDTKLPLLHEDQQSHHFIFASMRDAGVRLSFGSDWPVSSPDPIWGMHVAVNRTAPHNDPHGQDDVAQNEPLLGDERITVQQALRAYTLDSAYANGFDDVSGSITVGKSADFAILDRDPFEVVPGDLGDILVETTVSAGEVVYQRS
ncbi:amidohydrolase [Brevibacterium sp. UCMA 11754]|uniref:amidohydrolase n=1 Tax=Brevibacterium sp. UCMA 11754 TaxID=2749198 RepID=UPI001F23FB46|nr:amidohydrolase [Brevibacterium sp. UCMA 11754]MCF2573641.1 amidohydrolase [Brevibacterium sp. UCMA 11754]